jgi:hypothetical protein
VTLACPLCGESIDVDGPAVESYRDGRDPDGAWIYRWVPFVYDIHGHTPERLTHATCHGREYGLGSLVDVMHQQDVRQLQQRVRRSSE